MTYNVSSGTLNSTIPIPATFCPDVVREVVGLTVGHVLLCNDLVHVVHTVCLSPSNGISLSV